MAKDKDTSALDGKTAPSVASGKLTSNQIEGAVQVASLLRKRNGHWPDRTILETKTGGGVKLTQEDRDWAVAEAQKRAS